MTRLLHVCSLWCPSAYFDVFSDALYIASIKSWEWPS
jgi:hypothetical protein